MRYIIIMRKNNMKLSVLSFITMMFASSASAQYAWQADVEPGQLNLGANVHYNVETQASFSNGKTPLWLNANKYGLSSLEKQNGYVRASVIRPLQTDSARRWGIGYGVDVAAAYHYTSKPVVQQAFVEARWLHGVLSVGAKQYPMELKNNALSSGAQTLGINARPVPQVRIALPEYWTLPFANHWLHLKGHIAYGRLTDNNWQHEFTNKEHKYADNTLYHSKAGYLMIGNPDGFYPLSVELGLETATLFGGSSYDFVDGKMQLFAKGGTGFGAFARAFIGGGSEQPEKGTVYQNNEGDMLGSWLMRVNYDTETWRLSAYADKFFEDHSSMFQLDYDGYGTGDEWNVKKDRRFLLYDLKDWMLGVELNLKNGRWLRDVVLEYVYTKYQSGPIYHDHTISISDHVSGQDNYYNHYIYSGWQHWGQVMGNPLYLSPIYNENGCIEIMNNRFVAWHLGFDGTPIDNLDYRVLATYQTGYGTYSMPYLAPRYNFSMMIELGYHFNHNWNVKGAFALDRGKILGNNYGGQITISKSGIF